MFWFILILVHHSPTYEPGRRTKQKKPFIPDCTSSCTAARYAKNAIVTLFRTPLVAVSASIWWIGWFFAFFYGVVGAFFMLAYFMGCCHGLFTISFPICITNMDSASSFRGPVQMRTKKFWFSENALIVKYVCERSAFDRGWTWNDSFHYACLCVEHMQYT